MFNINQAFRQGSQILSDNAPALLTAFGAVGVVGTAVLSAKAAFTSAKKIHEAEINLSMAEGEKTELPRNTKIRVAAPHFVPAVALGSLSVTAIVMSNRISSKRAAVLAAAYALNQDRLEEYQEKVKEKLGVKKEKSVRDEIAQDRTNRDYDDTQQIFTPLDGKVLIREEYTGRYFWSTIEDVKYAVNEVNALVVSEGSARLSDFYDLIGVEHVSTSDYFGFTREERIELEWSTCTTPDGKLAVHSFEYVNHPVMNPEREAYPFR